MWADAVGQRHRSPTRMLISVVCQMSVWRTVRDLRAGPAIRRLNVGVVDG